MEQLHPAKNQTSTYVNGNTSVLYLRTHFGLMIFMSATLAVSTVVGTLGNLLVVLTISLVSNLRTCGNMFILNLALADLLITALVDPFNAAGAVSGEHFLMGADNSLCAAIGSVCAPVCMSSMWNLSLISLNRYVRICQPHVYHRIFTAQHTFFMCLAVWVCGYMTLIPTHAGWSRIIFDPDFYLCTADTMHYYSYAVFYIAIGICVPLVGVVFGYSRIFHKVRHAKFQVRRHRPIIRRVNADCVNTVRLPRSSSFTRQDLNLVKTLFTTSTAFFVCWLPFAALVIAGHPLSAPKWVYVVAMVLAHGNSAINPILYGLSNQSFRQGYLKITGCGPIPGLKNNVTNAVPMHEHIREVLIATRSFCC